MPTIPAGNLCRITVFGPDKRVDLAVPVSLPVSNLMPLLLKHTSTPSTRNEPGASWVLQRLGQAPMQPSDTPESLDWNEGEQLYLRSTENSFPEMKFDDLAHGMATSIINQPGRWRAEYNHRLFLGLSVAMLVLIGKVLLDPHLQRLSWVGAAAFAIELVIGSVLIGRNEGDRSMIVVLGLAGCVFAALGAVVGGYGLSSATSFEPEPVLAGGLVLTATAGVLILSRLAWAPMMPFIPFGALIAVGLAAALAEYLYLESGWNSLEIAGTLGTGMLLVLIYAPRSMIRAAGLRVPQLPRTAEEMQQDIEPSSAPEVTARTVFADQCLAMVTIATAVVLGFAVPVLARGGWFGWSLAIALSVAALIRSGVFKAVWPRVSLAFTGAWGVAQVALVLVQHASPGLLAIVLIALASGFVALQAAMIRPHDRRLLPIWGRVANHLELLSAAVALPIVLQLFGVYGWARGLMQ